MISFIEILRAIAVVLITNSHFDGVYPINISFGGCPGVALFFAITGFLLWKPAQIREEDIGFRCWYLRKLIKLYVPLTIVNLITVIIGYRPLSISLFLFPININLWYVPAIAVLYIVYFFVIKYWPNKRQIVIIFAIAVYAILYIFIYDKTEFFVEPVIWFRLLYGIIAMLLGSYVREYYENDKSDNRTKTILYGLGGCFSLCAFLIVKLLLGRLDILMKAQFLTQVFGVGFAILMLLCGCKCKERSKAILDTRIGCVIRTISRSSLEIYLVQFAIIGYLKDLIFPLNFVLIIGTIAIAGTTTHWLSEKIERLMLMKNMIRI